MTVDVPIQTNIAKRFLIRARSVLENQAICCSYSGINLSALCSALGDMQNLIAFSRLQSASPEEAQTRAENVFMNIFDPSELIFIPLLHQLLTAEQALSYAGH